jgi:serine/threonine protein kinase
LVSGSEHPTIKLADFGFAAHILEKGEIKLFNSYKGTRRGYMAPEIHECLKNRELYYDARRTDIFSLGVILFALLLGKLPF